MTNTWLPIGRVWLLLQLLPPACGSGGGSAHLTASTGCWSAHLTVSVCCRSPRPPTSITRQFGVHACMMIWHVFHSFDLDVYYTIDILFHWKCNFPFTPQVRMLVGRLDGLPVFQNSLKGLKVSLPCSYRRPCYIIIYTIMQRWINNLFINLAAGCRVNQWGEMAGQHAFSLTILLLNSNLFFFWMMVFKKSTSVVLRAKKILCCNICAFGDFPSFVEFYQKQKIIFHYFTMFINKSNISSRNVNCL